MAAVFDWHTDDAEGYLAALVYCCPFINSYLDDTLVKGNTHAQAVVDCCYRLFLRFADFQCLKPEEEDNDGFKLLCSTFKRLDGLTTRENYKQRQEKKKKK